MRALLLSLLAASQLASGAATVYGQINRQEVEWALSIACAVLDDTYDCPSRVPVALAAEMDGYWGLYYSGTDIVWINEKLVGPHWDTFAKQVLIHELAHYIVDVNEPGTSKCDSEAAARRAGNAYAASNNRGDLTDYHWQERYKCE